MKAARLGLVGLLVALAGAPAPVTAQAGKTAEKGLDWNQFRGPNRDAHSSDSGLLQEWPKEGPPLAWKASGIGVGFSSVSVSGTHAFTMGEVDKKATLLALNVADGKILWKLPFGAPVTDNQGGPGPRSTPATDGTLVIALAPAGELVCARVADGKVVWQKNVKEFGANEGSWHFSESPLLDGASVVLTPGGTVVAL
ncbi:MAG TPA: PQQ-binding-like beta-propeller repeat protein, partial [Planctomycetota bacterium]|nr:PQQ-binding-like beta-propeller repeat protein [Planctomycetota bacterium]